MNCFELNKIRVVRDNGWNLQLDHLDFPSGQLTAIIGPNGAGKTSLLRILLGFDEDFQGTLRFMGRAKDSYKTLEWARQVAWVPSQMEVSFDISVLDLVMLGRFPWNQGLPTQQDQQIAEAALRSLHLQDFRHRMLSTLSSGERQKVQIARALATKVHCIVLDEPCSHLDIKGRYQLFEVLSEIAKEGCTIIFTSHDLLMSSKFAQNTVALKAGRLFLERKGPLKDEELSTLFDIRWKSSTT